MLDQHGFDLWADGYDQSVRLSEERDRYPFAGYRDVLNTIYRRVRAGEGKSVLDLGFGTAVLTKRLYDDGIAITGVDFSQKMIDIAQEKMPQARLFQQDLTQGLPQALSGERFDFIVCTYAIHHLTDDRKAAFLAHLRTHLNPGGEILLGDVAFETQADQAACQAESGEEWDEDESYMVMERLAPQIPGLRFQKCSTCAGVCVIPQNA